MKVVLDTSFILAVLDAADPDHARVLTSMTSLRDRGADLLLPALVLGETAYMLERDDLHAAVEAFVGNVLEQDPRLEMPTDDDLRHALSIEARYGVGLTDSTVAALAERTGASIATLDRRHFTKLRTARGRPFRLVP